MALGECGETDSSDVAGESFMNRIDTHDVLRICISVNRVQNYRSYSIEGIS